MGDNMYNWMPLLIGYNPICEGVLYKDGKVMEHISIFRDGKKGDLEEVCINEGHNQFTGKLEKLKDKLVISVDGFNIRYILGMEVDDQKSPIYVGNRIAEDNDLTIETRSNIVELGPLNGFFH